MTTRYQQLRHAVANLAAPADVQVAYLDNLFVECTGGGSAEGYGNDELGLILDDSFMAHRHMMEFGEINDAEVAAVKRLHDFVNSHWGDDANFWDRKALFYDPRWREVREMAARVLDQLPDELRESDFTHELDKGMTPSTLGLIGKSKAFLSSRQ
jgi:hypothetical protein